MLLLFLELFDPHFSKKCTSAPFLITKLRGGYDGNKFVVGFSKLSILSPSVDKQYVLVAGGNNGMPCHLMPAKNLTVLPTNFLWSCDAINIYLAKHFL